MRTIIAQINANENLFFLREFAGPIEVLPDPSTGHIHAVRLEHYSITLEAHMMYAFPLEFQHLVHTLMERVAVVRSQAQYQYELHLRVKHVPEKSWKEFRYKKSMTGVFPHCTICLEEFKSNEKVRQLHSTQCSFHTRCLRRHFIYSSRCPNCNIDCGTTPDPDPDPDPD